MAKKRVLWINEVLCLMKKTFNEIVAVYKEHLEKGEIQQAYKGLLKYLMKIKAHLGRTLSDQYSFGNCSPGYLDYSYFPFFNDFLRKKDLRLGVVLNHKEMRFELWLMGQNAETQKHYWEILKDTKWNEKQIKMPKYSVLETILVENPNFNDLNSLTAEIEKETVQISNEVINYLKSSN